MHLGDMVIMLVDSFKYLGVAFNNGLSLHLDCSVIKRKFYGACNAVLAKCKHVDNIVKLHLVETFCLPLLTYCIGALDLPQYKVNELVCVGTIFFVKYLILTDGILYMIYSISMANCHLIICMNCTDSTFSSRTVP